MFKLVVHKVNSLLFHNKKGNKMTKITQYPNQIKPITINSISVPAMKKHVETLVKKMVDYENFTMNLSELIRAQVKKGLEDEVKANIADLRNWIRAELTAKFGETEANMYWRSMADSFKSLACKAKKEIFPKKGEEKEKKDEEKKDFVNMKISKGDNALRVIDEIVSGIFTEKQKNDFHKRYKLIEVNEGKTIIRKMEIIPA